MKNNVIKFPMNKESVWMPENIDELVEKALDTVPFEPISKSANGDEWEYDHCESYLDDNEEVLMGHLVYEEEAFIQKGTDGDIEISRQIFITPESECLVFYTTLEENYCGSCDKVHCKLNRILSIDQSLSPTETEEVLCQLLYEINQEVDY